MMSKNKLWRQRAKERRTDRREKTSSGLKILRLEVFLARGIHLIQLKLPFLRFNVLSAFDFRLCRWGDYLSNVATAIKTPVTHISRATCAINNVLAQAGRTHEPACDHLSPSIL